MKPKTALLASAALLIFHAHPSRAETQTAVISCDPCSSQADLEGAALTWAQTQPLYVIVLVTSLNAPISGFFEVISAGPGVRGVNALTGGNTGAAALDNQIYSRAAKFTALKAPSNITYNETDEIIIGWIQTQMVETGQTGVNAWHLLPGFGSAVWSTMSDAQSGQVQNIYIGDTITVNYPNGYSEKWEYLGVTAGSIRWKRVPNTLMQNGQPVNPPTTPAKPIAGAGSFGGDNIWAGGHFGAAWSGGFCFVTTSVSSDGETSTWSGFIDCP